ncbi:T9SS type A sorting domain-containing protein [bacterium]|nr:T9SS type A sorting domain-containing protein [bacterium]
MNLRNTLGWLLVCLLFLPGLLTAQITITAQDLLGQIGSRQVGLEDRRSSIPVDVGSPGANQVWDFRMQIIGDTLFSVFEFLTPDETVSASTFPDANMVQKITTPDVPGSELFNFFNTTSDFFIGVGDSSRTTIPFDTSFVFFQNDTLAPLPIAFGNTWLTTERDTTGLFPLTANISIDTTLNTVDGWGTVRLPLGDFECLRLRQDVKVINQSIINGVVFSTAIDSFIQYDWISKDFFRLASAQSQNDDMNPNFTDAQGFGRLDSFTTGSAPTAGLAYGIDASAFPTINFASVPIPDATPITTIGATTANGQGGDFGPNDVFYTRRDNDLVTINLTDGSASSVASITGISSGQTIIGMGFDQTAGTMYLASTDLSNGGSELYTIDLSTAAASLVGPITNAQSVLGIAVNPAGDIFAFDDGADNLVAVDGATGAGTVVGALAINTVAQDADFDPATGVLYWTFFAAGSGRLATVDVSTGAATPVTTWSADFIAFAIFNESPPTSVREPALAFPEQFGLQQNYPNPFNPETVIQYDLNQNGHVELAIFNLLGEKVRSLVDQVQRAGAHQIRWNGLDDNGNRASSGLYVYRLSVGASSQTKRMILLR